MNLLPADKKVHRRVEVLVLYDGCNDQDVLQQRDNTEDQEHLKRGEKKNATMRSVGINTVLAQLMVSTMRV